MGNKHRTGSCGNSFDSLSLSPEWSAIVSSRERGIRLPHHAPNDGRSMNGPRGSGDEIDLFLFA